MTGYHCGAGNIAAWTVEAGDESTLNRVESGHENDRDRRSSTLGHHRRHIAAPSEDHRYLSANQIHSKRRHTFETLLGKTEFDRDILAVDEAGLGEALAERGGEMGSRGGLIGAEEANDRYRRLLRARRERPCRRSTAQCEYEFSPSDVDCHANPPAGGRVHATRGDDITL